VIDAGVRDVAELRAMDFPVWSGAVHAQGTVKETAGSVNIPVICAGATVRPGDLVVGDEDGVCVVPRTSAPKVLERSKLRLEREASTRAVLASGELGLDYYGLREKLRALGVEYVDTIEDD
jgi:4-hydroxy-4-methyl-2-oxoglutarate aldolase